MTVRQRYKVGAFFLNTAITITFLGMLLVGTGLLAGCDKGANAASTGALPAMKVAVVKAQQTDVPLTGEWVGTLDGYVNAQIQPQANGYLIRQNYREGSQVQKGQVLFEIDPRPFEAALQQAQGQLGQAQAQLALAQINVNRDTPLAEARAIAKSQLDNEIQQKAQAEAAVRTAEAAVATANLNLGFTQGSIADHRCRGSGDNAGRKSCQHAIGADFGFATRSHQGLLLHQRQRVSCADEARRRQRQRPASWSFEDSADPDALQW